MLGPAGILKTALYETVKLVQHGNSTQAIFVGLSMGPSVRENLKIAGPIK
jgi:hypothetical protein